MKGDKTQLRTPQIRPYPLQEKFKILFLGGYVYDVTNSSLCSLNVFGPIKSVAKILTRLTVVCDKIWANWSNLSFDLMFFVTDETDSKA